ncbi:hypothetical protein NDU88_002796 [Pleurodeles waltl]|uniref:Uncharacterized protein n=1 Tax=Pleurodeles waltl TaxID=8319 RepID=A0AAV7NER5_PLEWA|nr:hypothetical protein NDU88_002796 [Pleurodeles waltl]
MPPVPLVVKELPATPETSKKKSNQWTESTTRKTRKKLRHRKKRCDWSRRWRRIPSDAGNQKTVPAWRAPTQQRTGRRFATFPATLLEKRGQARKELPATPETSRKKRNQRTESTTRKTRKKRSRRKKRCDWEAFCDFSTHASGEA